MRHPLFVLVAAVALLAACSGGQSSSVGVPASSRASTSTSITPTTIGVRSNSPGALAESLTQIERALRLPSEAIIPSFGRAQQSAYGALKAHPEWRAAVLAAVGADVRDVVSTNVDADLALEALFTGSGPAPRSLPTTSIRVPLPAAQLLADYHEAEAATGVPWADLAAINFIESRFGRNPGQSTAGAQGPMQFEPATWAQYGHGANIQDDHDAILAAGRLLAASGGAPNIAKAIYAYNNSHDYVRAVQDYATVLSAAPLAFYGYYQWQVYTKTTAGTFLLPEGYPGQPAVRTSG
ncbi:MAG TPA: lytic transglycosylase domain-containing protein [Acidimicrobiia bacterium]|nr:lytic transglycosylase domain-containing protein [Acidimicrobiia bacterium]